jgi:hypothetical protein
VLVVEERKDGGSRVLICLVLPSASYSILEPVGLFWPWKLAVLLLSPVLAWEPRHAAVLR